MSWIEERIYTPKDHATLTWEWVVIGTTKEVKEEIWDIILTKDDYKRIKQNIDAVGTFNEILAIINTYFDCNDLVVFTVWELRNEANTSNGSRKVLAFAKLLKKNLGHEVVWWEYILRLFREHYQSVLDNSGTKIQILKNLWNHIEILQK